MIAAGLCMMGGCFAQDTDSQTVETYWPAHSVRVDHSTYILKDYDATLTLPLLTSDVYLGGRLENIVLLDSDNGGHNFLNWGIWNTTVMDACYFGTNHQSQRGAGVWFATYAPTSPSQYIIQNEFVNGDANGMNFMELSVSRELSIIKSSLGSRTFSLRINQKEYTSMFRIVIESIRASYDVVAYWWYRKNSGLNYFMVQPMQSVAGQVAFFTHRFNILTEL